MFQSNSFLSRMILLVATTVLVVSPLASAQLQLGYSLPDSIPFGPAVNYGAGYGPTCVFCADLDGDLDLDLAVTNLNSHNVCILKNNGDGTFQSSVDYATGASPVSVFCADLDGDLDLDLALPNGAGASVSILRNNGDGTFQPKVDYTAGEQPNSVFCADLDFDSDLDLAVTDWRNNNVSILRNCSRHYICGDVDRDNKAGLTDIVYLINYVFKFGPGPCQ